VLVVTATDGRMVGTDVDQLASLYRQRIIEAVEQYRSERAGGSLQEAVLRVAIALAAAIALGLAAHVAARRLHRMVESRYRSRVKAVGIQSFEIVRAERIWAAWGGAIGGLRTLLVVMLALAFVDYALAQFPWTRRFALGAAALVLDPLRQMGTALAARIPDLAFLIVLAFVVRYALKLLRLFLRAVEHGRVSLPSFDAEWAEPTYKLLRLVVIAFALVVAYPYVPGSNSDAFKAISVFFGVVFSIGSTTAIANVVAGYILIYRRAFKVGDRIRVGDVAGEVISIRLQVTHIRTPGNENVIVPNLSLLNQQIVNYSSLAKEQGVALRIRAGIGYDTPWRQVEAMLKLAARRTAGVVEDPAPFVLHDGLGDYAVNYELYAFVRDANRMPELQAALSRNVLDVFNEHGVQIMTPSYIADTPQPKLVKPDDWFIAPAKRPEPGAT
jgi:small-conductance mechanosensitive channel